MSLVSNGLNFFFGGGEGGGVSPLHKLWLYRYLLPRRVWFLNCFGLK